MVQNGGFLSDDDEYFDDGVDNEHSNNKKDTHKDYHKDNHEDELSHTSRGWLVSHMKYFT